MQHIFPSQLKNLSALKKFLEISGIRRSTDVATVNYRNFIGKKKRKVLASKSFSTYSITFLGWDSVARMANYNVLDSRGGRGVDYRWRRDFPQPSRPTLGGSRPAENDTVRTENIYGLPGRKVQLLCTV